MQYPDPEQLAKRVMLQRSPSGKVHAVFRHNDRNPKSVWGKEVPYYLTDFMRTGTAPVLCFDNYVVPVALYLCALEATQDLPISASPYQIRFVADPHERVWTLLDKNVIGGALNQESMKSIQGTIIVRTYSKVKDEMPDAPVDAVVAEVADRMCRSRTLVRSVLGKAGVHLPEKTKSERQTAEVKPHRFSNAYSFKTHFKTLSAIVQTCRSSVIQRRHKRGIDEPCSFSLADLDDRTALGGYPVRCPVLGIDLRWDEDVSWFSPRVGRYDPKGVFLSNNVVLMSKLAKRITEGLSVRSLETLIDQYPYMATAFAAWASEHPVPSTPATNLINSMPKVPVPPAPTLEEQKKKEQGYFDMLDNPSTPLVAANNPAPTKPLKELSVQEILGGNWDED